jgi:hypothetical protein
MNLFSKISRKWLIAICSISFLAFVVYAQLVNYCDNDKCTRLSPSGTTVYNPSIGGNSNLDTQDIQIKSSTGDVIDLVLVNNTDKDMFVPHNQDSGRESEGLNEFLSFNNTTKSGGRFAHQDNVTDGVEICVDGKHLTDGVDIDGIAGDDISGCHNSKYSVGEWDSCSNAELSRSVLCYDDLDDDDQYELLSPDNEPTIVNSACLGAVPIGKQDLPSSCITSNDCTTNGIIATCTGYQPAGTGYCTTSFGIADQPCVNNTSPSNCFSQTGQRDACTWDANELNPAEKCKNTIYNINEINCGDYNDSAANCSLQTVSRQGACAWQSGNSAIPGSCACSDGVFTWVLGDWSVCSASCGGGNQTRTVECHDSAGNTVSDSLCSGAAPAVTQACNTQSCPGGSVSACGICSSTSQCPSGHNCQALQGGDSFCEPSGGPACMQ